jgi:probable HAF family extracellular repeat protein
MVRNISSMIFCVSLTCGTVRASDPQFTFVSFDYPGAASTAPQGVNAHREVVGGYTDTAGKTHGFLLSGGSYTSLDFPGALVTLARGINNQGEIVGQHVDAGGLPGGGVLGFLWQAGSFTGIVHPGHLNTIAVRITASGVIVGCYHDSDTMGSMHGYTLSGGNYTDVAAGASMNNGALADGSITAGLWTDMMTGLTHGFLANNSGLMPFDFPFSISTAVWDMNESGDVVGVYADAAKKGHGFLLVQGGLLSTFGIGTGAPYEFVSIDYPGAASTAALGINSKGDIVGSYVDAAGKTHGYLASLARRRRA